MPTSIQQTPPFAPAAGGYGVSQTRDAVERGNIARTSDEGNQISGRSGSSNGVEVTISTAGRELAASVAPQSGAAEANQANPIRQAIEQSAARPPQGAEAQIPSPQTGADVARGQEISAQARDLGSPTTEFRSPASIAQYVAQQPGTQQSGAEFDAGQSGTVDRSQASASANANAIPARDSQEIASQAQETQRRANVVATGLQRASDVGGQVDLLA